MKAGWLALLFAGVAFADQPLAVYPGAPPTRIGGDLVVGGELYRIGYFVTPDAMSKVASHFNREWEAAGYPVTVDGDLTSQLVISAFYTRQGLVRSIVLRKHGEQTLGFTVLKDLWVKASQVKPDKLPALEGALYANDLVTRGDSGGSQHRTAIVAQPLDAVRDARDGAWAKAGYTLSKDLRVRRDEDGVTQRLLEYARGDQQAVVTLVAIDAKTTAVDETWVGSNRADGVPNDAAKKARK